MESFPQHTQAILDRVNAVIDGKPEAARTALTVLLAGGHLLVEDVPGVGKTMLARTLASAIGGTVARIQFTPDLLPTDITGVSVYDQARREFEFKPGPVFANVVIGDEINRASAKTQSALLECMAEGQVTADGTTYRLAAPFMVVATQNPVEMDGTFPLPEAQRDRFTARISMGYPDAAAEATMLADHGGGSPLAGLGPVVSVADAARLVEHVRGIHVSDAVREYIVALGAATRSHPQLRLGASPRALLQLQAAARAEAALSGRDWVLPDDVRTVAVPVLAHRLILDRRAGASSAEELVRSVLADVRVPAEPSARGR
ncbi:AAA family ATPase [Kocuria flava]|uniref:ATPase n=1 Tax=Kocuria flava TaxID=446860 RepID=A0A2N4T4Z9_9MICC|nr:MoxR family ATPase [Kocuria flava]MCJ8505687.1 MoxR family ATPase [Kocuria flava]MCJ8505692.1 MoxR family ATPase [Kocuria flava]PLC13286.1 ATPase [Kocuria flava]